TQSAVYQLTQHSDAPLQKLSIHSKAPKGALPTVATVALPTAATVAHMGATLHSSEKHHLKQKHHPCQKQR
ncbi:MAG: hypothetical protein II012_04605, partial [Ruminococcus sp.]|nr:hypothetical protein [Ruminococcus sp.]